MVLMSSDLPEKQPRRVSRLLYLPGAVWVKLPARDFSGQHERRREEHWRFVSQLRYSL